MKPFFFESLAEQEGDIDAAYPESNVTSISQEVNVEAAYPESNVTSTSLEGNGNVSNDVAFSGWNGNAQLIVWSKVPFLSIALVCLLCMNATHFGVKKVFGYLFRVVDGKRKLYWPIVCINLARMGVILFYMTLFKWVDDLQEVAAYGLVVVFTMVVLHDLNSGVIDRKYHDTVLMTAEKEPRLLKAKELMEVPTRRSKSSMMKMFSLNVKCL